MKSQNPYPDGFKVEFPNYPFGMLMRERTYSSASYRFGFNGKENDDESKSQDYGMRIYNQLLGRFFSVDPLDEKYPSISPYNFAGNSPIAFLDEEGLSPRWFGVRERTRSRTFVWTVNVFDNTNNAGIAGPVTVNQPLLNMTTASGLILNNFINVPSSINYFIVNFDAALVSFSENTVNHTDGTWRPTNPVNNYNVSLDGNPLYSGGRSGTYRTPLNVPLNINPLPVPGILSTTVTFGPSLAGNANIDGCYGFTIRVKVRTHEKRGLWRHTYIKVASDKSGTIQTATFTTRHRRIPLIYNKKGTSSYWLRTQGKLRRANYTLQSRVLVQY